MNRVFNSYYVNILLLLLTSQYFAGCEDDPKPPTAVITAPSDAVAVGAWFSLSGEESLNPKGETENLSFEWRLLSSPLGSESVLIDSDTMTPDLRPDLPGTYEFALKVKTNEAGSPEVYAIVEAGPCGAQDPIIEAVQQFPLEPGVSSLVQLYALAQDPDFSSACVSTELNDEVASVMVGEAPFNVPLSAYDLSYQWRMISRPSTSSAELQLGDSITPLFTPDVSGDYHFEVLVTDTQGAVSESFIHVVSVSACGEGRPTLSITLPEFGTSNVPVEITSAVTDADQDCGITQSFHYDWYLSAVPAGSQSILNDSDLAQPSFIPDVPGVYTISGQVTDQDQYRSDLVSASITIDTCGTRPPVIMSVDARGLSQAESEAMAGEAMAGEAMAGEAMAGEAMAGEAMAGEAMAGEAMAGEVELWDDELIHVGEVVSFSATVSDPDLEDDCDLDARLDYEWSIVRLPAASQAVLNRSMARTPSLVSDAPGDYTVRLIVRDAQGNASAPMEVDFTVENCGSQAPTGESRFSPAEPQAGDLIALNANYTDRDQDCVETTLAYSWRFESLPAGSQATLNDAQAMTPSFLADVPGLYILALTVSDNTGLSSESEMLEILVSACGSNVPSIDSINHEPALINAGQAVRFSADVSDLDLDPSCGTRSESFSYEWHLSESPAQSQTSLNLSESASPSLLTDVPGEYEVSLRVRDNRGFESALARHRVTVGNCGFSVPSVLIEVSNATPATGETVAFNADVSDADNVVPCNEEETFSYAWQVLEAPAGSQAHLNNPQAKTPSMLVDVPGEYLVACTVEDSTGRQSTQVTLSLNADVCGNHSPQVQAVNADNNPRIGSPVRLSVQTIDSDNEPACNLAQSLSYEWRFTAIPVGSQAELLNAELSVASFVPDQVGQYDALVIVTDETGLSDSGQVSIIVGECGVRAPSVDSLSVSSVDQRVGTAVSLGVVVSDLDDSEADCDLTQELNVQWELSSAPTGSQARLDANDRLQSSFTPDLPGEYTVRVRAYDQDQLMSTWVSQSIEINDCGLASPLVEAINLAGQQPYNVGEVVRFSASVSDSDNDPSCSLAQNHRYQWRLVSAPAGSEAQLIGSTFPEVDLVPDRAGEYIIGLVVRDDLNLESSEARQAFVVDSCGSFAPLLTTISSNANQAEWDLFVPVRLSHDGVDPDVRDCGLSDELSYHWSIVAKPSGSMSMLNDASLSEPSLIPDLAGIYELSLLITDQSGHAAILRQSFVASTCGGQVPVASVSALAPAQTAVSPLAVSIGDTVQLDASDSSDADNDCGATQTLSYQWTMLRVPPASQANLSLPNGLTPWFVADAQGLYRIQLVVSDGLHDSAPVIFEVNAN